MYCKKCGSEMMGIHCENCGYTQPDYNEVGGNMSGRSKLVAGLLAIFIGSLGIHNFYLGYQQRAIIQLLVSTIGGLITCGLSIIVIQVWAFIEGIQLFTGSISVDGDGLPLKD